MAYTSGGRDLYLLLEDGAIEEVSRTDPTQFTRTFFNTNRLRVAGVANAFETTGTATYKGDREMSTCEMRAAAAGAPARGPPGGAPPPRADAGPPRPPAAPRARPPGPQPA